MYVYIYLHSLDCRGCLDCIIALLHYYWQHPREIMRLCRICHCNRLIYGRGRKSRREKFNIPQHAVCFYYHSFQLPQRQEDCVCIALRHPSAGDFTRVNAGNATRDQSYGKNNGSVVRIDESLLSTLCRSNVISVTPATTARAQSGCQHHSAKRDRNDERKGRETEREK